MTTFFLQPIKIEIEKRKQVFVSNDIRQALKEWNNTDSNHSPLILSADRFLHTTFFAHNSLTREQYFSRCYRISTLALRSCDGNREVAGTLGLLNDFLQFSIISREEIEERIGSEISDALHKLQVQKDLQRDMTYLQEYYKKMESETFNLTRVKVLEKLDELFLLGLKPDDKVEEGYLEEMEKFIIPLAWKLKPKLAEYFEELIKYKESLGHFYFNDKKEMVHNSSFQS